MQTTNISLSFHQLQSLLQTKKTADKQNHQVILHDIHLRLSLVGAIKD